MLLEKDRFVCVPVSRAVPVFGSVFVPRLLPILPDLFLLLIFVVFSIRLLLLGIRAPAFIGLDAGAFRFIQISIGAITGKIEITVFPKGNFATRFERQYSGAPKLELFNRNQSLEAGDVRLSDHWTLWGNEAACASSVSLSSLKQETASHECQSTRVGN